MTPWTVAHQTSLSMGFSRQEYWSGLLCPPPGDLPNPGIKPRSSALQADSLPSEKSIHLLSGHINRQRTPQTISWRRSKILVFYQNATTINEQKWERILLSRIWMLSLMTFGEDSGVGRGGGREKKKFTEDLQNNCNEILQFWSLMEKRHNKVYTSLALSKGKKEAKPNYSKADMIRRTNHRHRRFTHETFLFNSKQIILKKWVRCIFF